MHGSATAVPIELLLDHSKIESTNTLSRLRGDDAIEIAEKIDI
jgi:hypothetical protein